MIRDYATSSVPLFLERIDTAKIPWTILPPGEHPFSAIVKYFEGLQRLNSKVKYDVERLRQVFDLGSTSIYTGSDEFEGYVVFYFEQASLAVMECPRIGNAIYVVKGDWMLLSRLSKATLLDKYPRNVMRIVHSGNWRPSRLLKKARSPAFRRNLELGSLRKLLSF